MSWNIKPFLRHTRCLRQNTFLVHKIIWDKQFVPRHFLRRNNVHVSEFLLCLKKCYVSTNMSQTDLYVSKQFVSGITSQGNRCWSWPPLSHARSAAALFEIPICIHIYILMYTYEYVYMNVYVLSPNRRSLKGILTARYVIRPVIQKFPFADRANWKLG